MHPISSTVELVFQAFAIQEAEAARLRHRVASWTILPSRGLHKTNSIRILLFRITSVYEVSNCP